MAQKHRIDLSSARHSRPGSVFLPHASFLPITSQAWGHGQDDPSYADAMQPSPLKRSKTSQPSRHGLLPTSANMMPSFSTSYIDTAMAQAPAAFLAGHIHHPHVLQTTLPFRPTDLQLHETSAPQTIDDLGLGDIGMEPGQFLWERGYSDMTEPLALSMPRFDPANLTMVDFPLIPSSCGPLTQDATLDTAASRRPSDDVSDSMSQPIAMTNTDSRGSYLSQYGYPATDCLVQGYNAAERTLALGMPYYGIDDDVRGVGSKHLPTDAAGDAQQANFVPGSNLGGAQGMERTDSANTDTSAGSNPLPEPDSHAYQEAADMERSASHTSTRSSASSLRARAHTSLRRQVDNATKNPLKPKMPAAAKLGAATTPHLLKSLTANAAQGATGAGGIKNGKVGICKTRRERPAARKLTCDLCPDSDFKNAFRGEHELRRHKNRIHGTKRDPEDSTTFKKWICRDPREDGIDTSIEPAMPLIECKNCRDGKQYGIYYNSAAHLRRKHFKKRNPRRGSKRAPYGGTLASEDTSSHWPPMDELKKWMVEVTVGGDDDAEEAEEVEEVEEVEEDLDEDGWAEDEDCSGLPSAVAAAVALAAKRRANSMSIHNQPFFAVGSLFQSRGPAMAACGGEPAPANPADLPSDTAGQHNRAGQHLFVHGPDSPYQLFDPQAGQGPISSSHFFDPQANSADGLFPGFGLDPSEVTSSSSGYTVTQGTEHPPIGISLEDDQFDGFDSFVSDYLSACTHNPQD